MAAAEQGRGRLAARINSLCPAAGRWTAIRRGYRMDRGYERIEDKFSGLGAEIRRV